MDFLENDICFQNCFEYIISIMYQYDHKISRINLCNNVVGFAHEQGRPDRNKFITINFDAIAQFERDEGWPEGTWQNQFLMCNETRFGRKYGCKVFNRYDYSSISHYPNVLGEDIPRVIIVNKTSCGENGCQFGQRFSLSPLDVADIEKVYQCGK